MHIDFHLCSSHPYNHHFMQHTCNGYSVMSNIIIVVIVTHMHTTISVRLNILVISTLPSQLVLPVVTISSAQCKQL